MEFLDITGLKTTLDNLKTKFLSLDGGGDVNGPVSIAGNLSVTDGNIMLTATSSTESSRALVVTGSSGQVVVQPKGNIQVSGNTTGTSGVGLTITGSSGSSVKVFDKGIVCGSINDEGKVFATDGSVMTIYPKITDTKYSTALNSVLLTSWSGSYSCTTASSIASDYYLRFKSTGTNDYFTICFTSALGGGSMGQTLSQYAGCCDTYMTDAANRALFSNRWTNFEFMITPGCMFRVGINKCLALGNGFIKMINDL